MKKKKLSLEDEKIQVEVAIFMESLMICQELHLLPNPGGLHDQDSLFVYYMVRTIQFQRERQELDQHKAAQSARRRRK